jgi:hypothetical protein
VSARDHDCVNKLQLVMSMKNGVTQILNPSKTRGLLAGFRVIGSSDEVHVVDALAITGDEGRGSLR